MEKNFLKQLHFWKQHKKAVLIIAAITLFWLTMVYKLIIREYFPHKKAVVKSNYKQKLTGLQHFKKRKMAVFYGVTPRSKIGYLETSIEPREDGTFDINSSCRLSLFIADGYSWNQLRFLFGFGDVLEKNLKIELDTSVYVGPDYQIKEFVFYFNSNILNLFCKGKVQGGKWVLQLEKDGQGWEHSFTFPSGTMISSPLGTFDKFPKLEVGKQIHARWFDPISQSFRDSTSVVKAKIQYLWYGKRVPVYVVQTVSGPIKATAWVDESGETLEYQIFMLSFIKEPDKEEIKKYTKG